MLRRAHAAAGVARRLVIPRGAVELAGSSVEVEPFLVDRHLVTGARYAPFVVEGHGPRPLGWTGDAPPAGREAWPVVGVAPEVAVRFALWAGGRLPTEGEWQLAAAGFGPGRIYPWGDRPSEERGPRGWRSPAAERGWTAGEPVGERSPFGDSVFGLSDLGATWELTTGRAERGVIVRGGPWRDRLEQPRLSNRSFEPSPALDVGFRLVYPLSPRPWPRDHDPPPEPLLPPGDDPGVLLFDWTDASREPTPRTDAGRWRRELLDSSDGLAAYVHQNLAAAIGVESYAGLGRADRESHGCTVFPAGDVPGADRAGDAGEGYHLTVDREWATMAHSRNQTGMYGQHVSWFASSSTRCPMFVFTVAGFDLADFVSFVIESFVENLSSVT